MAQLQHFIDRRAAYLQLPGYFRGTYPLVVESADFGFIHRGFTAKLDPLGFGFQAALGHLRRSGEDVNEDDEARLSPLSHKHVNMLGHYSFTLAEQVVNGQLRPLNQPSELDEWPWRTFSFRWTSNPDDKQGKQIYFPLYLVQGVLEGRILMSNLRVPSTIRVDASSVVIMMIGVVIAAAVIPGKANAVPILNPVNGHYYEAIVFSDEHDFLTWDAARIATGSRGCSQLSQPNHS